MTDAFLEQIPVYAGGREWKLWAAQNQDALIAQVQTPDDLANFPYGLTLWPSAIALADALAEENERAPLRGKRVWEVGAGLGLAGIVAAHLGATVTLTDFLPSILEVCARNAEANAIALSVGLSDWRNPPATPPDVDLLIGADVLYERTVHDDLHRYLLACTRPGGRVLLADPLRAQALEWIEKREREGVWQIIMHGRTVPWEGKLKDIALFSLTRRA